MGSARIAAHALTRQIEVDYQGETTVVIAMYADNMLVDVWFDDGTHGPAVVDEFPWQEQGGPPLILQ